MKEIVGASEVIHVPAAQAWEVIGSIGGLDKYFPVISACRLEGSGVGATRYCTLQNGVNLKERIDEVDQAQMRIRYAIIEAPLPLSGYVGTVQVKKIDATRCEVAWFAEYTPAPDHAEELREMFRGALGDGIKGLEQYCKKPTA